MGVHADASRLELREIALVDIVVGPRVHIAAVEASSSSSPRHLNLSGDAFEPRAIASLKAWCAAATPLIMWSESPDRVHIYGPERAVTGLHRVHAGVASAGADR
jgi:hypothetical protein